ncbi:MAG: hypothetical protein KC589_09750 [Nanoarchaeota archaeon]|nr:hypothetical protein [Nanoarchaeota archaeon]
MFRKRKKWTTNGEISSLKRQVFDISRKTLDGDDLLLVIGGFPIKKKQDMVKVLDDYIEIEGIEKDDLDKIKSYEIRHTIDILKNGVSIYLNYYYDIIYETKGSMLTINLKK